MAVIHKTTLTPGKLELLTSWLPTQPWYVATGHAPALSKAGGFRLDDPDGAVGIEFMVVTDDSGGRPRSYHVPVTYRGAPLDGADQALIGMTEHGVLGQRWVYDATHDPVFVAQLLAFLQGRVEAQAQSVSDTPDRSVTRHITGEGLRSAVAGSTRVVNGPDGTDVVVQSAGDAGSHGASAGSLTLTVVRVPEPEPPTSATGSTGTQAPLTTVRGHVTADWGPPGGDRHRGVFVVVGATDARAGAPGALS